MINSRDIEIFFALFMCLSMISCVAPTKETLSREQQVSVEEQNKRVLEALQEISRLSTDPDQKINRSRKEAAYLDIIKKYPESHYVSECYRSLMAIYLAEYEPPEFEKAELLRNEFATRYSDSNSNDTLAEAYYRYGEWKKIIVLYTPAITRFVATGELMRPMDIFMYAEAKFHLGEKDEARKGYNIVMYYFPDSELSDKAKMRLDEISGVQHNSRPEGARERIPSGIGTKDAALQRGPQQAETEGSAFSKGLTTEETLVSETPIQQGAPSPSVLSDQNAHEKGIYSVQLGLFDSEKNAISLSDKLRKKGYGAFVLRHIGRDSKILFRVLIGRFHEKREAEEYAKIILQREGMKTVIIEEKE